MNKQLVYRIEDKSAKSGSVYQGPYFNNFGGYSEWLERSHSTESHPTCDEDKSLVKQFKKVQKQTKNQFKNTDFYCGFTSLDQLKNWFNEEERSNLHSLGFVLAVYEAEHIAVSDKQALFIPKKGKKRKLIKMPLE